MVNGLKKLVYFDEWMDPAGAERAAGIPGVDLIHMDQNGDADANWAVIGSAHGYQLRASTETRPEFYPNAEFIARAPNLLAVSSAGAGYEIVDVEACTEAGILVVNQTGSNAESVAQHVLAMMLTLTKQLIQADRAIRRPERGWTRWDFSGRELTGRTIGIVGLGNIGRRVAELCSGLFGMRVLAFDPYLSEQDFAERGAERTASLAAMFAEADFISINCPLTAETRGMIDGALIGAMKPTAYFVTTARGGIHDEKALEDALRADGIAGAGLDVFVDEPPAHDHPLMAFDNVIVSPHHAGITDDANYNMATWAADQWGDIFAGRRPPRLRNPDAWDKFADRYQALFGLNAAE